MSYSETLSKKDMIQRGNKQVNPAGNLAFFISRLLSPLLQYALLTKTWARPLIETLRGTYVFAGPPGITNTLFDYLGLSPYRAVLLAMSAGGMLKQTYWLVMIMQEKMSVQGAMVVGAGNAANDTLNTLLFLCAQTSASVDEENLLQMSLLVGTALYISGILIECLSEQQRHDWKQQPANKGKVYKDGLFAWSRHVNYFGYLLWHAGYALAAAGWTWAAVVTALSSFKVTQSIIPLHEHYMQDKYGDEYKRYQRAVPYEFIPCIW